MMLNEKLKMFRKMSKFVDFFEVGNCLVQIFLVEFPQMDQLENTGPKNPDLEKINKNVIF